ncbi:MAG: TRASH domain-containing protein [Candidatus Dadabacteria bacterium]|nr:TRASH domain-containing protein [Candidatus Dadabacteria bacterium]
MNTRIPALKALAFACLCLVAILGFQPAESRADNGSPAVSQVESKYVCMMTDHVFPKEQIPVVVENKTYYGCCEMCEARLKSSAESRVAVDPVSGQQVDKAAAVIGATPEGGVYYFESVENLKSFKGTPVSAD